MSWATVNLDESAKERFVSAYAPFSSQIQEMVTEVRQTIGSFGTVVVKFMEVFIGHALESLFTNDYLQEIEVQFFKKCIIYLLLGHFESNQRFDGRSGITERILRINSLLHKYFGQRQQRKFVARSKS